MVLKQGTPALNSLSAAGFISGGQFIRALAALFLVAGSTGSSRVRSYSKPSYKKLTRVRSRYTMTVRPSRPARMTAVLTMLASMAPLKRWNWKDSSWNSSSEMS